jgi:small-conductance mechanosensitive channel
VDSKLSVTSDINFAIEAALRAANITIPFPQRDVHVISNEVEKNATMGDSQKLPESETKPES